MELPDCRCVLLYFWKYLRVWFGNGLLHQTLRCLPRLCHYNCPDNARRNRNIEVMFIINSYYYYYYTLYSAHALSLAKSLQLEYRTTQLTGNSIIYYHVTELSVGSARIHSFFCFIFVSKRYSIVN